jgi:hypothetical protein
MKEIIMQHKIKILATLITASLSVNSFAAQEVLTGAFTTIKAVSITPITPISFTGLTLTANDTCTMTVGVDGTNYLGDAAMRLGNAATSNAVGATANTSCTGAGVSAFGVYEIDGAAGSEVNIDIVNSVTTGDVSIVPAGCAGDYVAGTDENGDECEPVSFALGTVTIRLAGADDTGSLGEGTPLVGTSLIAMGGVVTAENGLSAGQTYNVDFSINVTY